MPILQKGGGELNNLSNVINPGGYKPKHILQNHSSRKCPHRHASSQSEMEVFSLLRLLLPRSPMLVPSWWERERESALEEVCHWEMGFEFLQSGLTSCSLYDSCVWMKMWSASFLFFPSCFSYLLLWLSCQDRPYPPGSVSQNKPFLS